MTLALVSVLLIPGAAHANLECKYSIDQNTVEIDWTAYKTSQKVGVQGSFTEVTLFGDINNGFSVAALLGGLEAEINMNKKEIVKTGNPARDQTLYEHFFSLFKKRPLINGVIKKVNGNNLSGDFLLNLSMNKKTLAVPMTYTRDDQGKFIAKGGMDVNDFGLSGALANLHQVCEALHKGPDGISKTWPLVEIKLVATINKTCK